MSKNIKLSKRVLEVASGMKDVDDVIIEEDNIQVIRIKGITYDQREGQIAREVIYIIDGNVFVEDEY